MHPAALQEPELLKQCTLTRGRSSGPGGQHRNKVETLVELLHTPTGIAAHAGERRSAEDNKRMAVKRLRLALACDVRRPVPLGDARSDLWKRRTVPGERGTGRIICNPSHDDFPALVAEALDMLASTSGDTRRAALRLDVTPSSLLKLLKDHPPAAAILNAWRTERGLRPLK